MWRSIKFYAYVNCGVVCEVYLTYKQCNGTVCWKYSPTPSVHQRSWTINNGIEALMDHVGCVMSEEKQREPLKQLESFLCTYSCKHMYSQSWNMVQKGYLNRFICILCRISNIHVIARCYNCMHECFLWHNRPDLYSVSHKILCRNLTWKINVFVQAIQFIWYIPNKLFCLSTAAWSFI